MDSIPSRLPNGKATRCGTGDGGPTPGRHVRHRNRGRQCVAHTEQWTVALAQARLKDAGAPRKRCGLEWAGGGVHTGAWSSEPPGRAKGSLRAGGWPNNRAFDRPQESSLGTFPR